MDQWRQICRRGPTVHCVWDQHLRGHPLSSTSEESLHFSSHLKLTPSEAWSAVIRILVPNVNDLSSALRVLSKSCGAIETAIFEKNTFLLVAKSSVDEQESNFLLAKHNIPEEQQHIETIQVTKPSRPINRFELITKLIKTFKNDSRRYSSETFESLRMEIADFTLVLESLTATSYILVIASNDEPRISEQVTLHICLHSDAFVAGPEAITLNISMVRSRFEQLQIAAK